MYRKQLKNILSDINKKMVFIVGPRQVGKTWLAKQAALQFKNAQYLNFDNVEHQEIIKKTLWPKNTELLILDELHKMKNWKNFIKGVYDTKTENLKIMVTGSARMDTFRQSGDSLLGRFFLHHLLPFSMAELKNLENTNDILKFIQRGGFPESYLAESEEVAQRWRAQYYDGLIRTDILDFQNIHDLKAIKLTLELLRRKVGSAVSFLSLAEDVQVSPATVKKYINILESLYIIFKISPYSNNIARAILKEPKIYFYDNGLVIGDEGAKFENFVALSLLKHILGKTDYTGKINELNYLRDKEGRETDFVLVEEQKVVELVEAKLNDNNINKNLIYYTNKYNFQGKQVVLNLYQEKTLGNINVVSAEKYLSGLYL